MGAVPIPFSPPSNGGRITNGAQSTTPNNFTHPEGVNGGGSAGVGATPIPGSPAATTATGVSQAPSNPYIPPTNASTISGTNTTGGAVTSNTGDPNQNNLQKQLTDIYGKGIGGELTNLLGNISGTDSQALQEYITSLQPQEATAQASTNATLGAQGVSGNSSVAAIADSNLQAQETSAIAGYSAQLQTQQENLEAGILTGTEQQAANEVSQSGWTVFGDVLGAVGSDVAQVASSAVKGTGSIIPGF